MRFSLAIYHRPDVDARMRALAEMVKSLNMHCPDCGGVCVEDKWARVFSERVDPPWNIHQHDLHPKVWRWALSTDATHHVFMTDDLHIAPSFWSILSAMVEAKPHAILGLLSNHPAAVRLATRGERWYRTNSWVVGPCYVVSRGHLERFLPWYEDWIAQMTLEQRGHFGDDSALNFWITRYGPKETWHPLPTIIEHRGDIGTTWIYGGDCFSRERVSWRSHRHAPLREAYNGLWSHQDVKYDLAPMAEAKYWDCNGPMLNTGGARGDEG